jgi:hypothetical protein
VLKPSTISSVFASKYKLQVCEQKRNNNMANNRKDLADGAIGRNERKKRISKSRKIANADSICKRIDNVEDVHLHKHLE